MRPSVCSVGRQSGHRISRLVPVLLRSLGWSRCLCNAGDLFRKSRAEPLHGYANHPGYLCSHTYIQCVVAIQVRADGPLAYVEGLCNPPLGAAVFPAFASIELIKCCPQLGALFLFPVADFSFFDAHPAILFPPEIAIHFRRYWLKNNWRKYFLHVAHGAAMSRTPLSEFAAELGQAKAAEALGLTPDRTPCHATRSCPSTVCVST